MSVLVPDWLIASKGHVRTFVLTGQTVALGTSGATLSDDVSVTLDGLLSGFGVNIRPEKAEINAITAPRHHNVVVADSFSVNIAALKVNAGVNVDPLRRMINGFNSTVGYTYFSLSWVEGTLTGSIDTNKVYLSRGDYDSNVQGRGEIIASCSFDCIDPGATDFFKTTRA